MPEPYPTNYRAAQARRKKDAAPFQPDTTAPEAPGLTHGRESAGPAGEFPGVESMPKHEYSLAKASSAQEPKQKSRAAKPSLNARPSGDE